MKAWQKFVDNTTRWSSFGLLRGIWRPKQWVARW